MIYNFTKKIALLLSGLIIVVIIFGSLMLFKLSNNALSLAIVKNYIITQAKKSNIDTTIEDVRIIYNKEKKEIILEVIKAILVDTKNSNFQINLPLTQLCLNLRKIGQEEGLLPLVLKIIRPDIAINSDQVNIAAYLKKESSTSPFNINYFNLLNNLLIENGRVTFMGENRLVEINGKIYQAYEQNKNRSFLEMSIDKSRLKLAIDTGHKKSASYNLQVTDLPLEILTKIMNGNKNKIFFSDNKAVISNLEILLTSSNQIADVPEIKLKFANGGELFAEQEKKISGNSELKINLANIPIKYITEMWPDWIGSDAKNWADSHILSGDIVKGTLWVSLCSLQTRCIDHRKYNNPDSDRVSMPIGVLRINNAELRYLEEYPAINNIFGTISLDKHGIIINANSGTISKSSISKVIVRVPYEIEDSQTSYITIKGIAEGPAVDLIEYIPQENIITASKDNIELKNIAGKALTNVMIKIPMKEDFTFEEVIFDIKSELQDIGLERLPNNAALSQGKFEVIFDGQKVAVLGKGKLDNNNLDIDWVGYIKEDVEYDTILKLKTEILAKNAEHLKILDERILKDGQITVDTIITSKNNKTNININTDLKNAAIGISSIGFQKNLGERAKGIITAYAENDNSIVIDKLLIEGDNILINGTGEFDKALLLPNKLNFSAIKFLNNNLTIDYLHHNHHVTLNVKGESLDLNQLNFDKISNSKGNITEFSTFNGKIALSKVIMKNNVVFNKLEGTLECQIDNCNKGHLFTYIGKNSKNYLKILLTPQTTNDSILTLEADNASMVFNAFDIYKNVTDGILLAYNSKKYEINTKKYIFNGKILMQDFVAIKTPILAKLLTFSSLPGIVRLLGGNYIAFKELTSDIKLSNNLLKIQEGNIIGNELGLTMDGYINMTEKKINIEGTIVPELYSLNRTLAALPLIGYLMRENSKSKAVFAANYSIKGDLDNVNTMVNPISLFTPGFIKRIFTIFKHSKEQQVIR